MHNAFAITTSCVAPCFGARPRFPFRSSTRWRSATTISSARLLEIANAHEHADGHSSQKDKAGRGWQGDFVYAVEANEHAGNAGSYDG